MGPAVENVIGEALSAVYGKIDKLAEAINPQTSQVETNFLGIQENVPNATQTLESLFSFGSVASHRMHGTTLTKQQHPGM